MAGRAGLLRGQKEIAGKIDRLLEAVGVRRLKGSSVQAKLELWEARHIELTRELDGLKDESVRPHPNIADLYRRKVATLHDLLGSEATRTEAVEIIHSLIEKVTFRPTSSGRTLEIILFGDLARMVHLAQQPDGSNSIAEAVHEEFACSVKVVAGAGFEPATSGL
jgi:site-specific DNA recombinase